MGRPPKNATQAESKKKKIVQKQKPTPADQDDTGPLFFYMPNERHGEFCQWFPSTFYVAKAEMSALVGHRIDAGIAESSTSPLPDHEALVPEEGKGKGKGKENRNYQEDETVDADPESPILFKCAEQFMMYCKAGRFYDVDTQARILATDSPKEQKRLGRATEGFVDAVWDEVKYQVVVAGNMAKFGQNSGLKNLLLGTGDRELCEASGRDPVWGIGFTAKHALNFGREKWGQNLLGKALMETRERLRVVEEEEKERERTGSWKRWGELIDPEEEEEEDGRKDDGEEEKKGDQPGAVGEEGGPSSGRKVTGKQIGS